jgi:hypothetical protein
MSGSVSDRKIEKIIATFGLERTIAALPRPLRFVVTRKRYGWIDGLATLQRTTSKDGRSLIEEEKLGAIFVHLPKAAGTSVVESLFSNRGASHTPLYMYLALYGSQQFDRMFKFTFARHPIDRVVSAYNFLRSGGMTETDRQWSEKNLNGFDDVNDFICEGLPTGAIRDWIHFRSQMYFLRDPRTKTIGVDFVGRFENLASDFEFVARRLGVDAELGHVNQSARRTLDVSPEARKIVEKIYEDDFNELGY